MELTKTATDRILRFLVSMAQRLIPFTPVPVYPDTSQAWVVATGKVYKPTFKKQPLFPDARRVLVEMRSVGHPNHISCECGQPIDIPSNSIRSAASSTSSEGSLPHSPQDRGDSSSGNWVQPALLTEGAEDSPEYVLDSFKDFSLADPIVHKNQAKRLNGKLTDDESDLEDDVTPEPFASFTWVRALGEGGYAAAVAVREYREGSDKQGKGRLLCLKTFVKSVVLKRDLLHGVQRELLAYKTLASVGEADGSAFIMDLDGALEDKDRMYFAMGLMKYDLMAVLTEGKPGKENKKCWIAQIAAGLDFLHAIGIIHRDIKPENLMIDYQDNIRIADFGASHVSPQRQRLYPTGQYTDDVLGTWPYIAPEVMGARGTPRRGRKAYGTAVDYWALGCIVFELEAPGSPLLFETEADLDLFRCWKPEKAQGMSFFAALDLPASTESLILGLIHLDPLQRFDISDLRRHPYFSHSDGTTEFDDIQARAVSHPSGGLDETEDEVAHLDTPLIFRPSFREPKAPVASSTFGNLCWINPKGIWGPRQN